MTSRARLLTSIPFWILIVGSVAAGALGLWIVTDRLGVIERGFNDQTLTNFDLYGGQSWAIVGAVLLGVGVVGLLLALTLAAAKSLLPRGDVPVVEAIDQGFAFETTAAPVIAEDPDLEVPSATPAPDRATHDEPAIATEPAVEATPAASADDDKPV